MNIALNQCPYCLLSEAEAPPASGPTAPPQSPPPLATDPDAVTVESRSALARFFFRAVALLGEPEESPLMRGFRIGIGFMLAVVTILLLVGVFYLWLASKPEWADWVEQLWR